MFNREAAISSSRYDRSPPPTIISRNDDEHHQQQHHHSPVIKRHGLVLGGVDESDATSMTTTSTTATTTPSPYSAVGGGGGGGSSSCSVGNDTTLTSSGGSSPASSSDERTWNNFEKLTSLLSPKRNNKTSSCEPTSSLETSPTMTTPPPPQSHHHHHHHSGSSSDDGGEWSDESAEEHYDDNDPTTTTSAEWTNNQTPLRRGSPWSIQQALFLPEEEEEEMENEIHPHPVRCQEEEEGGTSSYCYSSPLQDSYDSTLHHHHHGPVPPQPIRTRRSHQRASFSSRGAGAASNDRGDTTRVPTSSRAYLVPRSNSTGCKVRASPQPLPSSSSLLRGSPLPYRSSSRHSKQQQQQQQQPPNSHSKSKKYKQHQQQQRRRRHSLELDLPGLHMEGAGDRSSSSLLNTSIHGSDILTRNSAGSLSVVSSSSTSSSTPSPGGMTRTTSSSSNSNNNSNSNYNWKRLLCRLRLTTVVWGFIMIGLTSLGRVAMLTSYHHHHYWAETTAAEASNAQLPPPASASTLHVPKTAGLRGSLLLGIVGRQNSASPSQDPASTTKKKKKEKKRPKDGGDKKKDKAKKKPDNKDKEDRAKTTSSKTTTTTTTTTKDKKKDKKDKPTTSSSSTTTSKTKTVKKDKPKPSSSSSAGSTAPKTFVVAQPPPLDSEVAMDTAKYLDHDPSMFKATSSGKDHTTAYRNRVVMLHDDVVTSTASTKKQSSTSNAGDPLPSRTVPLYPAEFTDNTQYYGEFDSSDERLRKMELREPYSQGECVPMEDWQTTFHPFCNGIHELGVEYLGEVATETDVQLFGVKGYWRYAWRLDLRKQQQQRQQQQNGDTVVLKTLKFRHDFEDAHFEHDRIDAVAMERLTSSPHVINVFGFCGHSVLTEYANGPRLGELADKSKSKPLARLKIARDIADGLADVHGIDNKDGNNVTFVHLDINPANVVSIGGSLKLNDFNIGIIRRWNTTSQKPCGFPAQYPNPQWRSPEESRNEKNLTEKVDVFSLGHIFFRLICGHEPWNKLEPGGKPSKETINAKVQKGRLPFIPETVMKSTDPEVAAIRDAMLDCYKTDPTQRPSAREISRKLKAVLEKLAA